MKDGFIKLAAATTDIRVADTEYNTDNIIKTVKEAAENGAKLIVFPELCITSYTCSDLFLQDSLLKGALCGLERIKAETAELDITSVVGLPLEIDNTLYNCAAIVDRGSIKGVVPKLNIPNYSEFYELRHFNEGRREVRNITLLGEEVPFGANILFRSPAMPELCLGVEICEDLWTVDPPSNSHALAGATVIANLSASDELISKAEYRELLIKSQSAKLYSVYMYADAGWGESTTDLVFAGDNIICENGTILARSERFSNSCVYAVADLERLTSERRKTTTFKYRGMEDYTYVELGTELTKTPDERYVDSTPFVPSDKKKREERSEEILKIQSMGLAKRIEHARANTAVIGVSGGLDSTLALLVTVRAFDTLGRDRSDIYAVTMPCFGTTSRTYNNAVSFAKSLGVTFMEVNIKDAVMQHFKDIGQDPEKYDVTYENCQARERTQVLMDIANKTGGMVVGTGDLSEMALGWATYNGDHMSMYAVNAGVPKTLIRYLVDYESERTGNEALKTTLRDILATPVSPELLPPKDGEISQKTENIVGPYELHDFFLYYLLRYGFGPSKILRLAEIAFSGTYDREYILGWLKTFYTRFFRQQFKRSCMPDAPKVGSVALSPRGDWRMPSDASENLWKSELEKL
ncbi:MAG TPA: NAD(+) synthase [Candidatus Ornithomonoglobus merdipullorum]|uniref:Glutamine-dependent NAD(+) synthetase n=1 Tax=Candidatus Ornithomonoglobus merdipullorum TaxID=2840895 RepID=A0A9D1MDB8_9FIRM|nr:NAD(+) synthase [Candidatus Ornithomonoglobus merdipullorum]